MLKMHSKTSDQERSLISDHEGSFETIKSSTSKSYKLRRSMMDPEQVARMKSRARLRFKAAIRFVLNNLSWIREELEERDDLYARFRHGALRKNVSYTTINTTASEKKIGKKKAGQDSAFPYRLKYLLLSKLENRTPKMGRNILQLSGEMTCYRGYPVEVREKLTMKSTYMLIPPGKIIIYPGAWPLFAYCLINGQIMQSTMGIDPVTHLPEERGHIVVKAGKVIAESALLNNTTQKFIYRTLTPCDFLAVPAEIFMNILESTVKPQWDHIIRKLKYFPQFSDWTNLDMINCARNCVIENYEQGQTVLGDGYVVSLGTEKSVHFLTSGCCQLIHDFDVYRFNRNTSVHYRLAASQPEVVQKREIERQSCVKPVGLSVHRISLRHYQKTRKQSQVSEKYQEIPTEQKSTKLNSILIRRSSFSNTLLQYQKLKNQAEEEKKLHMHRETKFVQICTFQKGHIFNLGENLDHRRIVALKPTECITVPRDWLLRRFNQDYRWEKQKIFLETQIPNDTESIFKEYCNEQKWQNYKRTLMDQVLQHRKRRMTTTIHDLPYHTRIHGISLF